MDASRRQHKVRRMWPIVFAALAALMLAACGPGAETAQPTTDDPTDAADGATEEPVDEGDEGADDGDDAAAGEELVIGALVAATAPAPIIGEAGRLSVQIAIDEINDAGGIDGRPVRLVIADTEGDPTAATQELTRLLSREGAEIIIGPMYSQETLAVLPTITQEEVFNVHMTASEDITPDFAPYSFGMLANAQAQSGVMVDYAVAEHAPSTVALIHDPGAQALTAAEAIKELLAEEGVELIGEAEHGYGEADMTPHLRSATRGEEPDVLMFYHSTGGDVGNLLTARRDLGLDHIPVVGNYTASVFVKDVLNVAGGDESVLEGVTGLNYDSFTYCEGEGASGAPVDYFRSLQEQNSDAADRFALQYSSLWYDAAYLVKAAVEGAGGATDGPTLAQWMYDEVDTFSNVNSSLSASPDSHFLVGADNLRIVDPSTNDEGDMQQAVDC